MIPKELEGTLTYNPNVMSGAVCFAGTRVPVQALLDTLDDGDSLHDFLSGYPDVTPEQARTVLHWEQKKARKTLGLELAE